MVQAEGSPSRAPLLAATELEQLWQRGQHKEAIRGALDAWEQVISQGDGARWLQGALRSCGLEAEAFAVQAQMTRRQGRAVRDWESLIRSVMQSGDPWWAQALLEEVGGGSRQLQALRIEIELRLGDASVLIAAWLRDHQDQAALEAAVDWWVRNNRVEEAERVLEDAERKGVASDGLNLWRARLALWRKQPEAARTLLERLPGSPEVRCLAAVVAVQEGRLEQAESLLRALVGSEVQAAAWSWLATVLRRQRRYAEAIEAADAASFATPDFNLVARLERELAEYERANSAQNVSMLFRLLRSTGLYALMRPIRKLEHAPDLYALGLRPRDPMRALEALLERFGGNHTPHLTTTKDGRLTSCRLPLDPRHLGASIQRVLWTRGAEPARALYRELAPRVNSHPLYLIYQGEIELWLGDYEAAARIFQTALGRDRKARWAWIGLGASAMLRGKLREAQQTWARGVAVAGSPGPTLYVYRGECYRRQGELGRARSDLELALRQKPQRLSARINLALVQDDPEILARVDRQCTALAPLLMAEQSGSSAERLEKMLEAMRGNRSSTRVSYHLWGRLWSFLAHDAFDASASLPDDAARSRP